MAKLKKVEIFCENNQNEKEYQLGTSLLEILDDQKIESKFKFVGAIVNNVLKELSFQVFHPKHVKFIDITHPDGMRMYVRSLTFVLYKAIKTIYPQLNLKFIHSISHGYFCELQTNDDIFEIDNSVLTKIKSEMHDLIKRNIPFERKEMLTEEAIKLYEKNNLFEKSKLFKTRKKFYTSVYFLEDTINYFHGHLIPTTGYLDIFDIQQYHHGFLLMVPKQSNPHELERKIDQQKLFDIFQEHKSWVKILGVSKVGSLNEAIKAGNANELIKISEALHEKKVAAIADIIHSKLDQIKFVFISGPSSSGKTSFSKRLSIQLKVLGLKPIAISLDNYFVNRDLTPKDENGDYDFESPEALDIKLFNENLNNLIAHKAVKIPQFNFSTGERYYNDETLKLEKNNIILIEGIHGLNPKLTYAIDDKLKFKIYVSALTQIAIDSHNRIPTTDNRLIRRIVRDYQYRSYSAENTIKRWNSVRNGEKKYIFPYQEQADIIFNSALLYELGVLKKLAEPILKEISPSVKEYLEAKRLLKFLSYFSNVPADEIPPTSILREFLGGSSFQY